MKCITYRIDDEKYGLLRNYCTKHTMSIQKLLDSRVDSVLKSEYKYCSCGINLFTLPTQDRILHLQNCKNGHNK